MKKKSFFALGLAFCSLGTIAQTYKLHDMTDAEFSAGKNQYFSFSEYRFASGTYEPFTLLTDSGRVNFYDKYCPERYQGELIGNPSDKNLNDGSTDYYADLRKSWCNVKGAGKNNDASSFIYVSRDFETYPTLLGNSTIEFTVPQDGYYKVTSSVIREDGAYSETNYLMAKFRFRYSGDKALDPAATLGFDYKYGDNSGLLYQAVRPSDGYVFNWYQTNPTPHFFYVYAKAGDIITGEPDCSHFLGSTNFIDAKSYWARDAWGRSKWLQFDAEVVDETTAKANAETYVDPYEDSGDWTQKLMDLYWSSTQYVIDVTVGYGVGQYQQEDVTAYNDFITYYDPAILEKLPPFNAKIYYEKILKTFEAFKAKANTIDYTLPENNLLFPIATTSELYPRFESQFAKTAIDSPWDFKSYTPSTGIYNAIKNYDNANKSGIYAWSDASSEWFYIAKDGYVHPTPTKSPVIAFTAPVNGVYHAQTTIQRNLGNANKNYMYTRYRFVKGGIVNGTSSVPKENFICADAYGYAGANVAVNREFYINMKAGDAITFEEDAYTANTNGSAGSQWQRLIVLQVPEAKIDSTLKATTDVYSNPYQQASNFIAMDSTINAITEALKTVKVGDELGSYPEILKSDLELSVSQAKDLRDDVTTTQYDLDLATKSLQASYTTFLTNKNVRYESNETLLSGAYYIELNGLYLTCDSMWTSGNSLASMYPHFKPLIDSQIKNNQVWNVQFNSFYTDPLRFSISGCLKNQTWEEDGNYHITEKGEIRDGGMSVAQSDANKEWRNHSIIYDGTNWCIYSVKNKVSLIFSDDATKLASTSSDKLYLYKLVPFGKVAIEKVNAGSNEQIVALTGKGSVQLSSTSATDATIYNATGAIVATAKLDADAVTIPLNAGFYIVKATNGGSAKIAVK